MPLAILKKIADNSITPEDVEAQIRCLSLDELITCNALFSKSLTELEKDAGNAQPDIQQAINKILNLIPLNPHEKAIYTVSAKEVIAGGVRIFLVIFTSVIGISLGLTNYPLLGVTFNAATTAGISITSVIGGICTGYLFHHGLKADTERTARDYQYYKLAMRVSEQLIAVLNDQIQQKCEQFGVMTENENKFTHREKFMPAARCNRQPATNDAVNTIPLEEISDSDPLLIQEKPAAHQPKSALPLNFIGWFKENKFSAISNTLGVTIGTFAGSLVGPGILIGIGKGIAAASIILPAITGPLGIAISLTIFAVISVTIGALFLYSLYKNGQRQALINQAKQAMSTNHCEISQLSQRLNTINNSIILKLQEQYAATNETVTDTPAVASVDTSINISCQPTLTPSTEVRNRKSAIINREEESPLSFTL